MGRRKEMRHSEEWWVDAPTHTLRCTASLKSTGGRCAREALLGTTVCRMHGGLAPAVQAAAATRISMTVEVAVKELQRILTDPNAEDRDKIAVAKDLLDRGGLGATSKVLVGIGQLDPIETLFRDILADPAGLAPAEPLPASKPIHDEGEDSPLRALESGFQGFDEADIVDAEIVEPAPEQHTVHVGESSKPPRHIREALARLL